MAKLPRVGLIALGVVFALDQFIKWLVTGPIGLTEQGMTWDMLPFFRLTNVHNQGVSLGFLRAGTVTSSWALIALTGAIAAAVLVWMWREKNGQDQIALGMIAGGALGNILDRIRLYDTICDEKSVCHKLGYVQDYANLHFGSWEPFLNFNLADAAITMGVLILLARALLVRDKKGPRPDASETEKSNA